MNNTHTTTNTTETTYVPALETMRQLGGARRLTALVGMRNCYHKNEGRTLVLYVMGGRAVEITIEADDTYTVTALQIRGSKVTKREPVSMVYVDALHDVLRAETGLAWRL